MIRVLDEGNLQFDFSSFATAEKFDDDSLNAYGLKAVDFVAEDKYSFYFLEIKDFQNPKAPLEQRKTDYKMITSAAVAKKDIFNIEMGCKIKDSLLRKYSLGETIAKKVVYLLFINLDKLGERERGMLKEKINGHVPTGLNDERFSAFTNITFDLVNAEQLKNYGIKCTQKV